MFYGFVWGITCILDVSKYVMIWYMGVGEFYIRVLYTVIVKKLYMHCPFFVNQKTENIWTYLELQVNVTNVHTITPIRPVLHNFIIYNIALTS